MVMTFSYIGAFVDPQGNMHNMPLVLVNEDAGAALGKQRVNLGEQVVTAVTAPNPQLGDAVRWDVLPSRQDALHRINDNQAYGGLVVPSDFSARVMALTSPAGFGNGPAQVEVLTNPAAGSIAGTEGQSIAQAAAARISKSTGAQLVEILRGAGVTITLDDAGLIADPVQARVTVAQPIGSKSGRGITPLYFAVMMTLAGLVGATLIDVGVNHMTGRLDLEILGFTLRRGCRSGRALRRAGWPGHPLRAARRGPARLMGARHRCSSGLPVFGAAGPRLQPVRGGELAHKGDG